MCCHKRISQFMLAVGLVVLGMASALADYEPNDNYSRLAVSYQSLKFAEPICIGSDCHDGVSGPALFFSYQLVPNFALGLSGSSLESNVNASRITSNKGSVFAKAIAGMNSRVDVGASVAAFRTTLDLCSNSGSSCNSSNDSGTDLGVFGKVFLNNSKSMSLALSYDRVMFKQAANQQIVGLAFVTIIAQHHRLAFSIDRTLDASGSFVSDGYGFGYGYRVF